MSIQSISQSTTLSAAVREFNTRNGTNVTVDEVAKANGLQPGALVRAGSQLRFPDTFESGGRSSSVQQSSYSPFPEGLSMPTYGADGEAKVSQMIADLKEPKEPPPGANEKDLAKYQQELQRYSRMLDMLTKIQQAFHDMRKGIIANFRV